MACHHHKICQKEALERAQQVCEDMGARFTEQRESVYKILWKSHKALTASEVMSEINNMQPPITYRALDFLKSAGLIHQIHSLNAYVGCSHRHVEGGHGILLICKGCRDVEEIHGEVPLNVILDKTKEKKFMADDVYMEVLGSCASCRSSIGPKET